jgi:hypothetical protein
LLAKNFSTLQPQPPAIINPPPPNKPDDLETSFTAIDNRYKSSQKTSSIKGGATVGAATRFNLLKNLIETSFSQNKASPTLVPQSVKNITGQRYPSLESAST